MKKNFVTGAELVAKIEVLPFVLERVKAESIRCGYKPLFIGICNGQALDLPFNDKGIEFCVPHIPLPTEEQKSTPVLFCSWPYEDKNIGRKWWIKVSFIKLDEYIEQLNDLTIQSTTALSNIVHNYENNMSIVNNMLTLAWKVVNLNNVKHRSLSFVRTVCRELEQQKPVEGNLIAECMYHALLAAACSADTRAQRMLCSGSYPKFDTVLAVYWESKYNTDKEKDAQLALNINIHLNNAVIDSAQQPEYMEKWYPKYLELFRKLEKEISKAPKPKWRNVFRSKDAVLSKEQIRFAVDRFVNN